MQLMLIMSLLYAEESFTDGTMGPSTDKPTEQRHGEVGMQEISSLSSSSQEP